MGAADRARARLVDGMRDSGRLCSAAVEEAFRAVPRHLFLPGVPLARAYADEAVATQAVDGVTTSSASQPSMMAIMLAQLDLRPGHRVLEIGAGTGYNAALMARLVGPQGHVVSVDIDADLVDGADAPPRRRRGERRRAGVRRRCTRPPARRALRPDRPHRRQRRRPPGVDRAARPRRPVAAAPGVAGHPGVGRARPRRGRRTAQRVGPPVLVRPAAGRRRRVRGGYDRGRRRVGAPGRRRARPDPVRAAPGGARSGRGTCRSRWAPGTCGTDSGCGWR